MKSTIKHSWILACLLTTATTAGAQAAVHVVDANDGAGTDFLTLPSALEFANEGDTVVIRSGNYDALVVTAKSLRITAERGATVIIDDTIHVEGLGVGQSLYIHGVDVDAGDFSFAATFEDNDGPVFLSDSELLGSGDLPGFLSGGIFISECSSVSLTNVNSLPTTDVGAGSSRDGILASNSSVFAYNCDLIGTDGDAALTGPVPGGNGATLLNTFLLLEGCNLEGGDGANGTNVFGSCTNGSDGGDGVRVIGATAQVERIATTLSPGAPGNAPPSTSCLGGTAGMDVRLLAGGMDMAHPGPALGHTNDSPVREGDNLSSDFTGPPGTFVVSFLSVLPIDGDFQDVTLFPPAMPSFDVLGAAHIAANPATWIYFNRGVIPAGGVLTVPLGPAPDLGFVGDPMDMISLETVVFLEQPLYYDAGTMVMRLGPPLPVVVLDSAVQ